MATISTTSTTNVTYHGIPIIPSEDLEEDIFIKIVSVLGLKISNINFTKDEITLTCKRKRSIFVIRITNHGKMTVENSKGKIISTFDLPKKETYSYPNGNPYIYPGTVTTTPTINPWPMYTTGTGDYWKLTDTTFTDNIYTQEDIDKIKP